jgi:hypothetical protein
LRITVAGIEVAKWCEQQLRPLLVGRRGSFAHPKVGEGIHITLASHPIFVDMYGTSAGVPTLDEDSYVEFVITREAFPEEPPTDNAAAMVAYIILHVDDALGGLVSRADKLQVEWGNR